MGRNPTGREARSLSGEAYDRLEAMIVSTDLAPGARFTLQRLQEASGFGRTPVLDAVKRLAANQLIFISPRSGLRIAPVNLVQERTLLRLRIEMEAIACGLASERATPQDQLIFRRFINDLETKEKTLDLERFNVTDRLLNKAILTAAGEPLLENTLAPLQTLYRRTGWLFHTYVAPARSLHGMIDTHISLLRVIAEGRRIPAEDFARSMIGELYDMIDHVRRTVDPALLDVSLADVSIDTGFEPDHAAAADRS